YLDDGYTYDFNELNINVYGSNSHALYVGGGSNLILDDKTSLNSFNESSYALYSNGGTVINTDTLNVFGNILSSNNGDISLVFNDTSSFMGSTALSNGGNLDLSFDNSVWTVTRNSILNDLNLSNGASVNINGSSEFITLITDNLFGNGAFDVKIDANNSLNDKIIIGNSSYGNHIVRFDDRTTGGYVSNGSLSLSIVENSNPSGDYQANFSGQIELGAFIYSLTWDNQSSTYYVGDISPSGNNNSNNANSSTGGVNPPPAPQTSSANSSVGFAMINYAINYINTQNILKRMGELRERNSHEQSNVMGDMWVRTYIGKLGSFDDSSKIDGVGYYGVQIGTDKLSYLSNGRLYTGLTFGYLKADADYEKGESQSRLYDVGIYALYKDDNDFYADAVIKYIQNKNSFDTVTVNNLSVNGNGDSNGFSLSAEVGKRYSLKNNFYIEPQAELTYTKQGELSVKSSNNLKTSIEGFDSYLARGSIIAGYKLKDTINIYVKTGFMRELDGKTSYAFNNNQNTKKESYTPNRNSFDNAFGVTLSSDSHNFYIEGNYQKGDEFDNMGLNVGYRYGF
ncbi:MAG: autotransporter outer membrane beta-barrel domain-containing protein, partial [Campylobacteraceae bacterium]|nr:autotransporter outer membrane beta-barrel domain-containing protein [Campylobacteraceae bacterium]